MRDREESHESARSFDRHRTADRPGHSTARVLTCRADSRTLRSQFLMRLTGRTHAHVAHARTRACTSHTRTLRECIPAGCRHRARCGNTLATAGMYSRSVRE